MWQSGVHKSILWGSQPLHLPNGRIITPDVINKRFYEIVALISVEDLLADNSSCITDLSRHAGLVDIH